ncbi:MAG: DUF917 domain-containing protein [Alphaproteobacteria bacterium]|nr:DUF917 domain-containing protein [Alphaproteobacteria bacterium]
MKLALDDLVDFARGAAFLGTGGGGDPYIGRLMVENVMRAGGAIEIIAADQVPDDALVVPTAMMGAPTVIIEKLVRGDETGQALRRLERILGRKAYATMPIEAGGLNSMIPLVVGAQLGLPVVDADGMGRAFPEVQMVTFSVYGVSASPMTIVNEHGECVIVEARSSHSTEWLGRVVCTRMGGAAHVACYPMSGRELKDYGIRRTMSLSLEIGRAIRRAREHSEDPFEGLIRYLRSTDHYRHAQVIFDGKIGDMRRETTRGWAIGYATIEAFAPFTGTMEITFRNENLVARVAGKVKAIVPDLICICDRETAEPITTEALRYGQRVKVMGVSVPDIMRRPESLAVFGPRGFQIDEPFQPIETLF